MDGTREGYKQVLGRKMKFLRKFYNLTQEGVREGLGYESSGTVSQIERGEIGMSLENIYKAADLFHVHPAILVSPDDMTEEEIEMHINLMIVQKSPKAQKHLTAIKSLLELAAKD
jgi:transcriptional regulator with XRE-family HTH domain